MKNFKLIFSTSFIGAIILSLISIWIFEYDWPFLPYLFLAGCFLVWIQKETVSYKFLDKLLVGSLLFGFLLMIFIFFRMYIMSYLFYDMHLPFRELWDEDTFILAGVYCFVVFLGGLLGIALKGFFSLYKNKLDKIIIILGPFLVLLSSLAISKIKISGTIMSSLKGWPYPFFVYQIKDVVDGFFIAKWIFLPGSFYHYIIFDYFLYFFIFILTYYLIKLLNKKLKNKKINITFFLFSLLVVMILIFTSFLEVKKSYISQKISSSGFCEDSPDCVIVGNVSPFSCAVVVNKNNADKILKLIKSFPSTGELSCSGKEKAVCIQNKCRVSIDHTSDETYWDMVKEAIQDCRVSSIMQTHNLGITAVLKNGYVIKVKEPEIDDVFDVVAMSKDKCGDIIMATE